MSADLTPRQRTILRLRANGATRGEILDQFHIAPSTFAKHLTNAYRRLGIEPSEMPTGLAAGALHEAWRRLGWLVVPDA